MIHTMTRFQQQKVNKLLLITAISSSLGGLFAYIMVLLLSTPGSRTHDIQYLLLGSLTGFFISSTLISISWKMDSWARKPLWFDILIKPLMQTMFIILIYSTIYICIFGLQMFQKESWILPTLLFSFIMFALITFFENLERLLGKNVLKGLILGTYHKPVRENRFVMFLDIAGSTSLAERVGDVAFHALLNDFFCEIARPIVNNQGEIYKYVGDEVIITWKESTGKYKDAALAVLHAIDRTLERKKEYFISRYGTMPEYRAGLHFGQVVAGEMGLTRQEIAFSGDVMNTASRIQGECRNLGERFLVSEAAVVGLGIREGKTSNGELCSRGSIALRGKKEELNVYALHCNAD